jgi:hypothetical protein
MLQMTWSRYALPAALALSGCSPKAAEPLPGVSVTPEPVDAGFGDADPNVTRARPPAKHCVDEAQDREPEIAGKVVVLAKVFPDGRVFEAEIAETSLPRDVTECIRKQVTRVRFAPPGGTGNTLTLPFQFGPRPPP